MKDMRKGPIIVIIIFMFLNYILYKLNYISLRMLILLILTNAYYTPFINFNINDKKKWFYMIITLATYTILAISKIK